ncbi:MAG: PIG-L family deacetylase [Pirellulaceae bacterium]|nr:PIG-L family deacetylase [Pirellulaceae bacterium]
MSARLLVIGAHPDDAEILCGGLIARYCRLGSPVKIVSVTDGRSGHHRLTSEQLIDVRRAEALAAAERVGALSAVWSFPDARLTASLEVRQAIIGEIRDFRPDLVITHRPYDYHPDHRAVGLAVQDASYLVTVPLVCADKPALRSDPVVAYMTDTFTRPCKLRADVILEISDEFNTLVDMAACHASQVFEWLPYHDQIEVPSGSQQRRQWLAEYLSALFRKRREFFAQELVAHGLPLAQEVKIEAYEISQYATQPTLEKLQRLFPGLK